LFVETKAVALFTLLSMVFGLAGRIGRAVAFYLRPTLGLVFARHSVAAAVDVLDDKHGLVTHFFLENGTLF
jgi:hypothetical protein